MTDERITDFADGDAMPDKAWFDAMAAAAGTQANGVDSNFLEFTGGFWRVGVAPNCQRPASGVNAYVIDDSMDYRERMATLWFATVNPQTGSGFDAGFDSGFGGVEEEGRGAGWPGIDAIHSFTEAPGMAVVWFGHGEAIKTVALQDNHYELDPEVRLYAREGDGALMVDVTSTYTQDAVAIVVMLHASCYLALAPGGTDEQTQEMPPPYVVDGGAIVPHQLNFLQDTLLMGQLREGDTDFVESAYEELGSMPLGPLLEGPPPSIPYEFVIQPRAGTLREYDATINGLRDTYPTLRRQRVAGGGRQIVFGVALNITSDFFGPSYGILIDNSIDWRDRFIYVAGMWGTTDIRMGEANDVDYAGANPILASAYTWQGLAPGAKLSTDHLVAADGTDLVIYAGLDGNLYVRNDTVGTRYLAGMIIASPQLGPGTPKE